MDRQIFGINIKVERSRMGITQEELARRMKLSRNMIDRLENGRNVKITFTRIKELSDCIECDIASLLMGTGVVESLFKPLVKFEYQGGMKNDE